MNPSPFLSDGLLTANGFKKEARELLEQARVKRYILHRDIAYLLFPETLNNKTSLGKAMLYLIQVLQILDVSIRVAEPQIKKSSDKKPGDSYSLRAKTIASKSTNLKLKPEGITSDGSELLPNENSFYAHNLPSFYTREIMSYKPLSKQETTELFRQYESTKSIEVRNTILLHTVMIVWPIAYKYKGRFLDYDDLIQIGTIGLIKAIERYDWEIGALFESYARWLITGNIKDAILYLVDDIRPSRDAVLFRRAVYKAIDALTESFHREPLVEELASYLGLPAEKLKPKLARMRMPMISLDESIAYKDEVIPREQVTACEKTQSPDFHLRVEEDLLAALGDLKWFVSSVVGLKLGVRKTKMFCARYGLADGVERTMKTVGEIFDLTESRICQVVGIIWSSIQGLQTPIKSDGELRVLLQRIELLQDLRGEEIDLKSIVQPLLEEGGSFSENDHHKALPESANVIIGKVLNETRSLFATEEMIRNVSMYVLTEHVKASAEEIVSSRLCIDHSQIKRACESVQEAMRISGSMRTNVQRVIAVCLT